MSGAPAPRRGRRGGSAAARRSARSATRSTSSASATRAEAKPVGEAAGEAPRGRRRRLRPTSTERGEHRLLRIAEPLEHGGGVRIRRRPRRAARRRARSGAGGSGRARTGRAPPAHRVGELGQRPLEHPGCLEEPPRAHAALAEQVEQARRGSRVPRVAPRSTCPSQSSSSVDGARWSTRRRRVERDHERVLVGWLGRELDVPADA